MWCGSTGLVMTDMELGAALRRMYNDAPRGGRNTAVLLFAIKHAAHLSRSTGRIGAIVQTSGLRPNWATEIHKGRNLAEHVALIG